VIRRARPVRAAPLFPAAGRGEAGGGAAPAPPAGPGRLVVDAGGARLGRRRFVCAIGRGGILPAADKREGDGASPAGLWRLTHGWWRADRLARPATRLAMTPIGPGLGWSDDPDDPDYNAAVALPHPFGHERLWRADRLYDIVIATDHNRPPVPGRGSAIFLHCWRAPRYPTAGCVALAPGDLLWLLQRWTPEMRLVIRGAFRSAR